MTDALAGSDLSWIGIDGGGRLGWFTLNGAGPAPEVAEWPPATFGVEERGAA